MVHYVIVRSDLTHGQQVAQAVHAVGESHGGLVHPAGTVAVALSATDKKHLLEIYATIVAADIKCVLIIECDGEPMAIGVCPTRDRKSIRKVTSTLKLVK